MYRFLVFCCCLNLLWLHCLASPQQMLYQGELEVSGNALTGNVQMKFVLHNDSQILWSHDGTGSLVVEPTSSVEVGVSDGLYSVALGDSTLTNMQTLNSAVLGQSSLKLRVWVDAGSGFQLMTPDKAFYAVPYAQSVVGGHIESSSANLNSLTLGGLTYPTTSGNNGQVLGLDSSGDLGWLDMSSSSASTAGNAYAFKAYLSADNQILSGWTPPDVVDFDTTEFDTTGGALINGGNTFRPTVEGYYLLTARAEVYEIDADEHAVVRVYKNGSFHAEGTTHAPIQKTSADDRDTASVLSAIVYANGTTDYFNIHVYHTHNDDKELSGDDRETWFSGVLLSGFASATSVEGISSTTDSITFDRDVILQGNLITNPYSNDQSNVALGSGAFGDGALSTGYHNVAIGANTLAAITSGGLNTGVGHLALEDITSGRFNTALGHQSLRRITGGTHNTGLGSGSLRVLVSGNANTTVGSLSMHNLADGRFNSGLGVNSLQYLTSGSNNVAIGKSSGEDLISGNNNIFIGYEVQPSSSTVSYELNIADLIKGNIESGSLTLNANVSIEGSANLTGLVFPAVTGSANQVLTTDGFGNLTWEDISGVSSPISDSTFIRVHTGNGSGSVDSAIRRFATVSANVGSEVTYADSATNGATFTINAAGVYHISYTEANSSTSNFGISLNSNELGTNIAAINVEHRLAVHRRTLAHHASTVSWSGILNAGDVIRAHNQGAVSEGSDPARVMFTIVKIGSSAISSGNRVVVEAHSNGGESLTANTTNMPFSTEVIDTHNAWDGTTFTVPETGDYSISGMTYFTAYVNGSSTLFVDGVFDQYLSVADTTSSARNIFSIVRTLNEGEMINVRVTVGATLFNDAFHKIRIQKLGTFDSSAVSSGVDGISSTSANLTFSRDVIFQGNLITNLYSSDHSNTLFGVNSMGNGDLTGTKNTAFGTNTLRYISSGYSNTAVGENSLGSVATGTHNTAIGVLALANVETVDNNVAVGSFSLQATTEGHSNTAVGVNSLKSNQTGHNNVAIGRDAAFFNQTGVQNVAVGVSALRDNVSGDYNIALGNGAANNLVSGNNNIVIGSLVEVSQTNVSNELNIGDLIKGDLEQANLTIEGNLISAGSANLSSGLILGNSSDNLTGSLRFTGTQFQAFDGNNWQNLLSGSSSALNSQDAESFNNTSSFTTASNTTFGGNGTFSSTFSLSTTANDLINGSQVYKLVLNGSANVSQNDFVASQTIDIPQGYRGRLLGLKFQYKYDGGDGEIRWVARDVTNDTVLTLGSETLDGYDNSNTAREYILAFFCPATCEQVLVGPQVVSHAGGETLIWDDVELMNSPVQEITGQISQGITHSAAGSTLLSGTNDVRFDLTNFSTQGQQLINISDNGSATLFTALKDCVFNLSASATISATGHGLQVKRNGTAILRSTSAYTTDIYSALTVEVKLSAGEYISLYATSGITSNGSLVWVNAVATADSDQVVASTVNGENSMVRVTNMSGAGAVNTKIRRFTTLVESFGSAITYADSANDGSSFTINESGIYHISYSDGRNAASRFGITKNSTELTTAISSITNTSDVLAISFTESSATVGHVSWSGILTAGDVIRPHGDFGGASDSLAGICNFTITKIGQHSLVGLPLPLTVYLKDVKASSTAGGTFTSGAWQTRDLNTFEGATHIITTSGNQFTLGAGSYEIEFIAPGYRVDVHKAALYNVTDAGFEIIGTSGKSDTPDSTESFSSGMGSLTITENKTFEIQHRCNVTNATSGFGAPSSFGVDEVYTTVKITKIR